MANRKPFAEFRELFFDNHTPGIKCPLCNYGYLKSIPSDVKIQESLQSQNNHNLPEWEADNAYGAFIGKLICDSSKCKNEILYTGEANHMTFYSDDGDERESMWVLKPKYFSQPINIIPVDAYSKKIKRILLSSFELFWIDEDSCGNKIRIIVELILDTQKIPRFPKKGPRRPISLHQRIVKYRVVDEELAKLMEAIKWIGNHGSHKVGLKKDDLLQAYGMLNIVLTKLYNNSDDEFHKIARRINKKRKPESIIQQKAFEKYIIKEDEN